MARTNSNSNIYELVNNILSNSDYIHEENIRHVIKELRAMSNAEGEYMFICKNASPIMKEIWNPAAYYLEEKYKHLNIN